VPKPPADCLRSLGASAPRRRARALQGLEGLVALLCLLGLLGCVTLRPFAEIRRERPAAAFIAVDGHQIYVEQQGNGDPVVLLHGFGESSYTWRLVAPELARSFRVVAFDLYGFGWTERPRDAASYTTEGQERLVLGVLAALGIRRAQFVGHSYGGALTLHLAADHPDVVGSMVLVDSAAPTYSEDRRTRLANVRPLDRLLLSLALRPAQVRSSLLEGLADPALVTPDLVTAYLDRLRVEGEVDAYYGLTAHLAHRASPDGLDRSVSHPRRPGDVELERLAMPALLVWGADDHIVPSAGGRKAAARLPHADFVLIGKAGHLPMEDQPAALLRAIVPFLKAHGGD
jgi:pimeloyl-ACP methyl ester carboxylesterase